MLSAIRFDHQTVLDAREVENKWAERMLAPKLVSVQTTIAESRPQTSFGVRHAMPQVAGFVVVHTGT
jgi:hypothetical protein